MAATVPIEVRVVLRDGTRALIRDVRLDDRPLIQAEYTRLSPESRFHRFLAPVPRLTDTLLTQLVDDVDYIDHVALGMLAADPASEPAEFTIPVGIGRFIRYQDMPDAADVAVTVVDQYQGRGVASALLAELVRRGPAGVRRLMTVIAADNEPSLAMLRRLGQTTASHPSSGIIEVEVALPDPP